MDAYDAAKAGGKHDGFLREYAQLPSHRVRKAVRSLRKRIAEHEDKIADPDRHLRPDTPPAQRRHLIETKWPADIVRQREQIEVLQGILRERGETDE